MAAGTRSLPPRSAWARDLKEPYLHDKWTRWRNGYVSTICKQEGIMKLVLGKPDGKELVLAEHKAGSWQPNPNLTADMAAFLQGSDPEQFEMWVEEVE
jgi:hypothetical protein